MSNDGVEVAMSQPVTHCGHRGPWKVGLGGQQVARERLPGLVALEEPDPRRISDEPVVEVAQPQLLQWVSMSQEVV
ncbi:MAG TPA: hypothetical protein VFN61_14445 [Acidimicrobiales bacterium]|nr:hypothetical protein [Acidimicrobiales bacterium]